MFYSENMPLISAKSALIEGRYKITIQQKVLLKEMEDKLNIPASTLVRMALQRY